MSVKKQLFIALQNQLNAKVKDIKWIDKHFGQIQALDNEQGAFVPMPGVLIEFSETNYKTMGGGRQTGALEVRIYTLYQTHANSFKGSPNIDNALAYFDFNERVHQALQGFNGECFTQLNRINDEEDAEHKNFIVTIHTYTTIITDDSANPNRNNTLVTAAVEPVPQFEKTSNRPATTQTTNFIP
jgi:hypothetical protein